MIAIHYTNSPFELTIPVSAITNDFYKKLNTLHAKGSSTTPMLDFKLIIIPILRKHGGYCKIRRYIINKNRVEKIILSSKMRNWLQSRRLKLTHNYQPHWHA